MRLLSYWESCAHRAYYDALATAKLYQTLAHYFEPQDPKVFQPLQLQYKIKKVQPATPKQIALLERSDGTERTDTWLGCSYADKKRSLPDHWQAFEILIFLKSLYHCPDCLCWIEVTGIILRGFNADIKCHPPALIQVWWSRKNQEAVIDQSCLVLIVNTIINLI